MVENLEFEDTPDGLHPPFPSGARIPAEPKKGAQVMSEGVVFSMLKR
jgi:hypothetical protein